MYFGWSGAGVGVVPQPGGHGFLDPREGRDDVDVEHLAGDGGVAVEHRSVDRVDPGVVDEVVQSPERLPGSRDDLVLVGLLGGVPGDAERVVGPAERLHRVRERLGLPGGDDDLGTLRDEAAGDAQADPPTRPGDDGAPSGQVETHEQVGDGGTVRQFKGFAVQQDLHGKGIVTG